MNEYINILMRINVTIMEKGVCNVCYRQSIVKSVCHRVYCMGKICRECSSKRVDTCCSFCFRNDSNDVDISNEISSIIRLHIVPETKVFTYCPKCNTMLYVQFAVPTGTIRPCLACGAVLTLRI